MSSKQWIMVRLDRTTHAKLLALRASWESDSSNVTTHHQQTTDRFGLSLDSVVNELIRRCEGHKDRVRKAHQKRVERTAAERRRTCAEEMNDGSGE